MKSCSRIFFYFISFFTVTLLFNFCSDSSSSNLQFRLLSAKETKITFENTLKETKELSIMNYMYFYNGGGVGAGDFNNDGRTDLFFTSNLGLNKIYLNEGGLKFKDVTEKSGLSKVTGWSTGVSLVDINNDGLLDIYVNQVGGFLTLNGKNKLFVCTGLNYGIPQYEEKADEYGLGVIGFSTQSVFFDYDLDGDLDMFLLNHSVHENGTFGERNYFIEKSHETAGDKLFRNDSNKFVEVTKSAGIQSSVIGYGLGIATGDINNDGWTDIYIGNDFHENDYLYINQKNGTFKESLEKYISHTSKFSMGVDIADVNNDGNQDIFSLDMQPYEPLILKSSQGDDDYTVFDFKLKYGYSAQFSHNNLQLNNGNGTFSEIARFSKIHATDWSWSALFMDFDNDGIKDLFVTNGIPRRMNDLDYINFRENNEDHKFKTGTNRMEDEDIGLLEQIPRVKLFNKLFANSPSLKFSDIQGQIVNDKISYSNGAAYADFDDDGDLDIAVNNINEPPFIYKNLTDERKNVYNNSVSFHFSGPPLNKNAIGAKVILFKGEEQLGSEHFPVKGFLSSMLTDLHVGVGDTTKIDSAIVVWPDQTFERLTVVRYNKTNRLSWKANLPKFDFKVAVVNNPIKFEDITKRTTISYSHVENDFVEFDRERLMPFMVSTEGPAIAVGDIDMDGLDDIFFGSSKRYTSTIYKQMIDGTFKEYTSKLILMDSVFEDVDAVFEDIDNDRDLDLIVASGGNEFWGNSEYLKQRYYLNNGKGHFTERRTFPNAFLTASCVLPSDFDGDGLMDFFFGARAEPKNYGEIPRSYLFRNLGKGEFKDVTNEYSKDLSSVGLVTDGDWCDLDKDGDSDLILALEWGSVKVFVNNRNNFQMKIVSDDVGWWKFILPGDFDDDGDIDFIAGNSGLNTRFDPSFNQPVRLYFNDFDGNGQAEQIMTYYLQGKEISFASYTELTKQLPYLKKKFLYARDFARASIDDLIGGKKVLESTVYEANTFENSFFENTGNELKFVRHALPQKNQLSTLRAGSLIKVKNSDKRFLLLGGNFYNNNTEIGRFDGDYGSVLSISKEGMLKTESSLKIAGQIRKIVPITIKKDTCYVIVRNNDRAIIIKQNN